MLPNCVTSDMTMTSNGLVGAEEVIQSPIAEVRWLRVLVNFTKCTCTLALNHYFNNSNSIDDITRPNRVSKIAQSYSTSYEHDSSDSMSVS